MRTSLGPSVLNFDLLKYVRIVLQSIKSLGHNGLRGIKNTSMIEYSLRSHSSMDCSKP